MPYTVDPSYITILRNQFLEKYGQSSTLHDADISELVNIHYSSGKLSHDEEAGLTVGAMAGKGSSPAR